MGLGGIVSLEWVLQPRKCFAQTPCCREHSSGMAQLLPWTRHRVCADAALPGLLPAMRTVAGTSALLLQDRDAPWPEVSTGPLETPLKWHCSSRLLNPPASLSFLLFKYFKN